MRLLAGSRVWVLLTGALLVGPGFGGVGLTQEKGPEKGESAAAELPAAIRTGLQAGLREGLRRLGEKAVRDVKPALDAISRGVEDVLTRRGELGGVIERETADSGIEDRTVAMVGILARVLPPGSGVVTDQQSTIELPPKKWPLASGEGGLFGGKAITQLCIVPVLKERGLTCVLSVELWGFGSAGALRKLTAVIDLEWDGDTGKWVPESVTVLRK